MGLRRWWPLLGWAATMLVVGLSPLGFGWGNVPDPVASHWGSSGAPDGHMPLALVPLVMVGLVVIGLLTTSLFRVDGEPTPEAFAIVGLMGGMGAALNGLLVFLNWDAVKWDEAGGFEAWHMGIALV
ncbi:MAG: hypothetical protein ACRDZM_14385, partial [Acidimicrobiia bacterium]